MRNLATLVLTMFLTLTLVSGPQSQPVAKQKKRTISPVNVSTTLTTSSETVVDPYVLWPTFYGVQQTGSIGTTFDCYGLFGDNAISWPVQVPEWPHVAFETPPGSTIEYLWGAGLWIGGIVGLDTLVSHGMDDWFYSGLEFRSVNHPVGSVTRFDYPTDYSLRAVFTDTFTVGVPGDWTGRPHIPLSVLVASRSHVWRTPEDEDLVIYDLVITNIGDQLIEKAYLGFFADTDIGESDVLALSHLDDLTGSIRELGLAYAIDNDGDPVGNQWSAETSARKMFAVRLLASSEILADTNFNWWLSPGSEVIDFSPRLRGTPEDPFRDFISGDSGAPYGDCDQYYVLSHNEWDYDQVYSFSISPDDPVWLPPPEDYAEHLTLGCDVRFLISWGSFDIEPDSSVRLLFMTFTADDVHDFLLNYDLNLPNHPYGYIASLDFTDVLANSARAEERAEFLLDPLMPVPGLYVAHHDRDSAVVAWDPWVFDNIEGYEVYFSEVPDEWLPYPGTAAPWLRPASLENLASLGVVNQFKLPPLDYNKFYFVNVAHRSQSGMGSEGVPVIIGRPQHGPAPGPAFDYAYFYEQGSLRINFNDTTGWEIDHYCVYRFADRESLENIYRPFYSEYIPDPSMIPRDSFEVDGTMYYYFAMEPTATLDAGATYYDDAAPIEGSYYVITAVDVYGFESDFSAPVQCSEIYAPTRDILLITKLPAVALASSDTVRNFYNQILSGYDWDIYSVRDTAVKYDCDPELEDCIDFKDFTRFKMAIIDLESYDYFVTTRSEERFNRLKKYILSGGRLAYFGCLYGMNYFYTSKSRYYQQETTLVEPYFGADSLFFYHMNYYYWNYLPLDYDSCFGFQRAEPVRPDLPEIAFDTLRHPFNSTVYGRWQDKTPPSVAAFVPTENAEILYRYRSRYPEYSKIEGHPVGLRVKNESTDTYLFGFHLWYMQPEQAQDLVQTIFTGLTTDSPETPPTSLPEGFALRQNYPNPFNPATQICYDLPRSARVTLEIYNILGQRVKTLVNGLEQQAGTHRIHWQGDNDAGGKVASGVYFYRLKADDKIATRKMMLLR